MRRRAPRPMASKLATAIARVERADTRRRAPLSVRIKPALFAASRPT